MGRGDQRRSAPNMREEILRVAGRMFAERGYEATSVRDIAAELGIANPSLYYHFSSKAELLEELLAEPIRKVQEAVANIAPLRGEERVRRVMEILIDSLQHGDGVATIALSGFGLPAASVDTLQISRPFVMELLGEDIAQDHREERVTMGMGAVAAMVHHLRQKADDSAQFEVLLRARRETILELTLKLLLH